MPFAFVVKKGVKSLFMFSSETPVPVSLKLTSTNPPAFFVETVSFPPFSIDCVPFKMRFEQELDSLKDFRDALKDLERQAAYDQIVKVCTSEQGAMANANIPAILDAMLLTASVDNRRRINHLSKRVDSLEEEVHRLKSQAHVDNRKDEQS